MAARKGTTALALSILLVLPGLTQAQTSSESDTLTGSIRQAWAEFEAEARVGVDECIEEAHRMLPAGRLLTVDESSVLRTEITDPTVKDGKAANVQVVLDVTIDRDKMFFVCNTRVSSDGPESRAYMGSHFSRTRPKEEEWLQQ